MGVAGELLLAAGHVPAFQVQLGAVGEGVLDRVGVEVLIDVVAAVVPAAEAAALTGQASFIQQHSSMLWIRKSLKLPPLAQRKEWNRRIW